MQNQWTLGYRAGKGGLPRQIHSTTAFHFGYDEGLKDRNRRAFKSCRALAEADVLPDTGRRRVVFPFRVPVNVEVADDRVAHVVVLDETPVRDVGVVEGNAAYLPQALAAADDGQERPASRFEN